MVIVHSTTMDSTTLFLCNRVFLFKNSLQSCSNSHRPCMSPGPSAMRTAIRASVGTEAISLRSHMKSKNLYELLEISPVATVKDIKRAYRKLAREFHPDHAASPQGKNESTQMFLRIHNAYVTLCDPSDRAQYDRQLLAQMQMPVAGTMWDKSSGGRDAVYGYSYSRNSPCKGRRWETEQCW